MVLDQSAHAQRIEDGNQDGGARGLLRRRVRYICEGAALGTKDFVNGIFDE